MCMIFKTLDRCELPLDTSSKGSEGQKLRTEIEFNQVSDFFVNQSYLLVKNHHNFQLLSLFLRKITSALCIVLVARIQYSYVAKLSGTWNDRTPQL